MLAFCRNGLVFYLISSVLPLFSPLFLPLLNALQRPAVPGTFGPLRGSDPANLYVSSRVPEPHPGEPMQQHQPFAVQVSCLLRIHKCKGLHRYTSEVQSLTRLNLIHYLPLFRVCYCTLSTLFCGSTNLCFLLFSCCQPPVGINNHRGPRLGTPEEKQVCGGLTHLSNVGSHSGSLQLRQMGGTSQDGNIYPPTQFQSGFIPPRHGGAPARPPDFPESSEIPPSHMYRSYKYLNRVHTAVWNGNHGATNTGPLGTDEKPPMGPGPSHQPRALGHMMDSRVMRPALPPNQWTEQSSFLPHGVASSGYMRPPCKSGGHRLQPPPAPTPSSLFGAPSHALRGVQGGDSMMDSPEMIAMQQLSSRVCPPGVPYHPRQPTPPHLSGPFSQVAHSTSVSVSAPKPTLGNPGRTQDSSETQEPENDRGNLHHHFCLMSNI